MHKRSRNNESSTEFKKVNLQWTEEMDDIYIDAMLEQQVNGNRVDGTFTPHAYANMVKICTEKFGFPFDKNHLKNRVKTLKENYSRCYDLFHNLSGFGWNPVTELFEAESEVWETLIKANPKAAKWRYTKVHSYEKLNELFSKDRSSGKQVVEGTLDSDSIIRISDKQLKKRKSIALTPRASADKKVVCYDAVERIENTIYEMFSTVKLRALQRDASNERTLYQKCLEELQHIEELDDGEFTKSVEVLKDDKNAIAFMTIKGPRRLIWLRSLWQKL